MSTFVLVHGSWHDGSAWNAVIKHLEAKGHQAFAPTIAGHGKGVNKNVNHAQCTQSIVDYIVNKDWKGACVVMDNAKIHCGEMVKEFIEEAGAKLIYLSPYSPDFSPIENFWSKVKSILRKLKTRNYLDLIGAIADAMLQVTKKDIHNWFAHCCYCTS